MFKPIKEYIDKDKQIKIYDNLGYETKISIINNPIDNTPYISVNINCKYIELQPYPIITYNRMKNEFEGAFNTFFTLTKDNKEEWISGINNASNYIIEMNTVIKDLKETYIKIKDSIQDKEK